MLCYVMLGFNLAGQDVQNEKRSRPQHESNREQEVEQACFGTIGRERPRGLKYTLDERGLRVRVRSTQKGEIGTLTYPSEPNSALKLEKGEQRPFLINMPCKISPRRAQMQA